MYKESLDGSRSRYRQTVGQHGSVARIDVLHRQRPECSNHTKGTTGNPACHVGVAHKFTKRRLHRSAQSRIAAAHWVQANRFDRRLVVAFRRDISETSKRHSPSQLLFIWPGKFLDDPRKLEVQLAQLD